MIKYILIFLFLSNDPVGRIEVCNRVEINTIACVNLLTAHTNNSSTPVDDGGVWNIVPPLPPGSTLTDLDLACGDLANPCDNPCIDFDLFGCGLYKLSYTVTPKCPGCLPVSVTVEFNKCCMDGAIDCLPTN